jgi:succinate dehydrogenase/fumarate reductase flavoprotein subunit
MAPDLSADVAIIGAGGAGMYAAIEAVRAGASRVVLLDRSLIGRGGATVMAQMTVSAATPDRHGDTPEHHMKDTLTAGRGLCDARLAALLCEAGVECILQMDAWRVGWAREGDALRKVQAPGHDRPRCVYVDVLNTGPAVSRTLRTQVGRVPEIRRIGDLLVTDILVEEGEAVGLVALDMAGGQVVSIAAPAVIVATGGLTRLYARNSASANMAGDGYALALRAGAALQDMEFVQFFPIGHLAPRLIGMDPIMWDPFRYKLGGRLVNDRGEDVLARHDADDGSGRYTTTRDLATQAIMEEVAAGRGSPSGGAWLSFRHVPEARLREAFGPVIEKLAANGIDLTKQDVEVAPIAHYHMGGVRVTPRMETDVPGLLAAGEAVGGANGANRLSGNAITEALAFGREAGRAAAARARAVRPRAALPGAAAARALVEAEGPAAANPAAMFADLQALMTLEVGPFRTEAGLRRAEAALTGMAASLGEVPPGRPGPQDPARLDWFDLRQAIPVAQSVVQAALARTESRGAHQRSDHPETRDAWQVNQVQRLVGGELRLQAVPA